MWFGEEWETFQTSFKKILGNRTFVTTFLPGLNRTSERLSDFCWRSSVRTGATTSSFISWSPLYVRAASQDAGQTPPPGHAGPSAQLTDPPRSCMCVSLHFHCVKSHYPKGGAANEGTVLWNGHRPVSCQSHLRLGEKDRKGKRRTARGRRTFKLCSVFPTLRH